MKVIKNRFFIVIKILDKHCCVDLDATVICSEDVYPILLCPVVTLHLAVLGVLFVTLRQTNNERCCCKQCTISLVSSAMHISRVE